MNANDYEVLRCVYLSKTITQREISKNTKLSLGKVNKSISLLKQNSYLNEDMTITEKTLDKIKYYKPKCAIILAAGHGLRMMPICREIPKAFLQIKNEVLIERLIRQLHEVDIREIYIVVGYLKEKFEYLIDKFSVKLIINSNFSDKNNMHSLNLAIDKIRNSYIIPSDIYSETNPFSKIELYPWYMVSDELNTTSNMKATRNNELVLTKSSDEGNKEIGIAYIDSESADKINDNIKSFRDTDKYHRAFWEEAIFEHNKCILNAKKVNENSIYEINTYQDLLKVDSYSKSLDSDYIDIICGTLKVERNEIENIESLKAGMTNKSFIFSCKGHKYIFRIPGAGTDKLINRKNEYDVYQQILSNGICDDVIYINPSNGYKITKFIENSRNCDAYNKTDVVQCMKTLKKLHSQQLSVDHFFDIFKQIEYYEKLRERQSVYTDYEKTKENIYRLKKFIDAQEKTYSLTHIDAVPDNFIITESKVILIDWEYAAMQDPHVDIAMFSIYALYDRKHIDDLIDVYFENSCDKSTRLKIYCYIAACGLLWSNWCEYKASLGVDFGEYSLRQYRYAKDFYRIFTEESENEQG